jgi:adenosylmethionine-8-amino-7-oxononanoate aminotransferase
VRRPRLLGSVAAFEVATHTPGYLNPVGPQLQRQALARGVFLRPLGQVVYLLPPLCIDNDQLAHCYAVIEAALSSL